MLPSLEAQEVDGNFQWIEGRLEPPHRQISGRLQFLERGFPTVNLTTLVAMPYLSQCDRRKRPLGMTACIFKLRVQCRKSILSQVRKRDDVRCRAVGFVAVTVVHQCPLTYELAKGVSVPTQASAYGIPHIIPFDEPEISLQDRAGAYEGPRRKQRGIDGDDLDLVLATAIKSATMVRILHDVEQRRRPRCEVVDVGLWFRRLILPTPRVLMLL